MSQERSVQDNEVVWKWRHPKHSRKPSCLIEEKKTDRRGLSFSQDELLLFDFREQNQNENHRHTLAKYEKDPNNYSSPNRDC